MNKLTVATLINKFNLQVIYESENNSDLTKREIKAIGTNRGGLELTGFKTKYITRKKRIMVLSHKETEYLTNLADTDHEKHLANLFDPTIPLIIVTINFGYINKLCNVAKKLKSEIPIVYYNGGTADLNNSVGIYIAESLCRTELVHGTLVNIFGYGVLITGESGIGKSETTLNLISNGHLFVGDDSIELVRINNKIIGRSSELVKNMIEIRGIGILDVTKMYGYHILMHETVINLVINLVKTTTTNWSKIDRLGIQKNYQHYFQIAIPEIVIPVTSGRNLADLIEVAVINTKLKDEGKDASIEFETNLIKALQK